jgi:LacI family transcriptional regulator
LRSSPAFAERPIFFLNELHSECSYVVADKQMGSYAAARHLFELGHQHILYLIGPDECHHDVRPEAFLYDGLSQACIDVGLDPRQCLHPGEIGEILWDMALLPGNQPQLMSLQMLKIPGNNPLLKTLRTHPEITAIMTQSDNLALMVHHILSQHHIRVPAEISLIGFDDTTPICDGQLHNVLTTVRVPLRQLGQTAAQLIIDQLDNNTDKIVRKVLPTKLIVRKTTAPPRCVAP